MTTSQPAFDLDVDPAAPERLRFLWRVQGQMPAGYTCGECVHRIESAVCLNAGPQSYDWRGEWRACGLWERANV